MPDNYSSTEMKDIEEIKEWGFDEFVRFSILQALRAATEDVIKYAVCVNNIEALMVDELEENQIYKTAITTLDKKHQKEYGIADENMQQRLGEMASFKFKELVKILKFKIPKEKVGNV